MAGLKDRIVLAEERLKVKLNPNPKESFAEHAYKGALSAVTGDRNLTFAVRVTWLQVGR